MIKVRVNEYMSECPHKYNYKSVGVCVVNNDFQGSRLPLNGSLLPPKYETVQVNLCNLIAQCSQ